MKEKYENPTEKLIKLSGDMLRILQIQPPPTAFSQTHNVIAVTVERYGGYKSNCDR